MDKLFLDANIFFTAVASEGGASRALFKLAKRKQLALHANQYALLEAKINIEKKIGEGMFPMFYKLVSELTTISKKKPTAKEEKKLAELINPKNLPILAGAYHTKAQYLITLDKKDFFTDRLKRTKLPFQILLPGDYLKFFLTTELFDTQN